MNTAQSDTGSTVITKVKRRLAKGLYTRRVLIEARRDVSVPFAAPEPKVPIRLRLFQPSDVEALFFVSHGPEDRRERADVAWRLRMIAEGALTSRCFVAVTVHTDQPCHIQWLTTGTYSASVQRAGWLPTLRSDEALLENAYTTRTYRRMGIMPAVTAQIVEHAASFGVRSVVAFVERDNAASLRGVEKAGLSPVQLHTLREYGFGLVRTQNTRNF